VRPARVLIEPFLRQATGTRSLSAAEAAVPSFVDAPPGLRVEGMTLTVSDTGPGFADGFLVRAFERFSRPDQARSDDSGGSGLGLAIVLAVAEAHGGTATARNRHDGGAEVVLTSPGPS
jgi:signal transduction histidine kinase